MTGPFWRSADGGYILSVRVQPGAKQDAVAGIADGVLKIRLKAPAIEGRANEALCAYLAELFGTAKSRVDVLKGQSSRNKQVRVLGSQRSPETVFSPGKTVSQHKKT